MVHKKYKEADFKMPLRGELTLNLKNIGSINKQRSISRSLKHNIELLTKFEPENNSFTLADIKDYLEDNKVTAKVISRIIMTAYEFDVIKMQKS